MKLVSEKNYKRKVKKMSDRKLFRGLYTTSKSANLKPYKLLLEEEILMRGVETTISGGVVNNGFRNTNN